MKKVFFTLCLILQALIARDDPFKPVLSPKDSNYEALEKVQNYFESFDFKLPTTARVLKGITITYQNIDGSIETKTIDINQSIDWHYPLMLSQKNAQISDETNYYSIPPFEFFTKDNKLYIYTNAKIQREFILPSPYRIVIDIDRKDTNINKSIAVNKKYFSKISMGTHNGFYRIVITLDGQYQYQINRQEAYYVLSLQ